MYKTPFRAETISRFKILFSLLVLGFLLWKLITRFEGVQAYDLSRISMSFSFVFSMLSLVFVNLILETSKWRSLVGGLRFWDAFGAVLSGMKAGFVTPNRVGEFAGRNAALPKSIRVKAGLMTIVGSFIQGMVTLIFGVLGMMSFPRWINLEAFQLDNAQFIFGTCILVIGCLICLIFRDKLAKYYHELKECLQSISVNQGLHAFGFAVLRYMVFSFQFYYCLLFCGFDGGYFLGFVGVTVVYAIQSYIPFSGFGELGVRELLAMLVFGAFMPEPWMAAVATFILWCFNICLPVLVGVMFSKFIHRKARHHG